MKKAYKKLFFNFSLRTIISVFLKLTPDFLLYLVLILVLYNPIYAQNWLCCNIYKSCGSNKLYIYVNNDARLMVWDSFWSHIQCTYTTSKCKLISKYNFCSASWRLAHKIQKLIKPHRGRGSPLFPITNKIKIQHEHLLTDQNEYFSHIKNFF